MRKLIIRISCIAALFFWNINGNAQELKPLMIGDRIPDVILPEMLNYTSTSEKLRALNNLPLILDFWFIGCASCIELMPHLDSLQKEYKGKFNLVLVTFNDKNQVAAYFNDSRYVRGLQFVQVVNDKVLRKLFPAVMYPHQVWIGKDGIVRAITDGRTATKNNLEKFIQDKEFDFKPKINEELDSYMRWVYEPAIRYNFDKNKSKILNYSYLSKERPEFNGFQSAPKIIDSTAHIVRAQCINYHFLPLYQYAYMGTAFNNDEISAGMTHINSNFIRKDSGKNLPLIPDFKNYDQYYCYELICHYDTINGIKDEVRKRMVYDLDQAFHIKTHKEMRKVKYWIIKEYGNSNIYRQKVGSGQGFNQNKELVLSKKIIMENMFPFGVVSNLNDYSEVPFRIEIPYKKRISFEMTWNPNDVSAMSTELRKYGLDITLEERNKEVIVMEDH